MRLFSIYFLVVCVSSFVGLTKTAHGQGNRAHHPSLKDGTHVLLRQNDVYGGIVLVSQSHNPESVTFSWWYRADGEGEYDANHESCRSGEDTLKKSGGGLMRFGPFEVEWSGNDKGKGWIYYGSFPNPKKEKEKPDDAVEICVTPLDSFEGVNTANETWIYDWHYVERKSRKKN